MLALLTRVLDVTLQVLTVTLIVVLACVVVAGVTFRYSGNSLIWYDELASVMLAWITFSGAALASLRNSHLGFSGLLFGLPLKGRLILFGLVETITVVVFGIVAWAGWAILEFMAGDVMTTLRFIPKPFVHGIVPVSAAIIVIGRFLTFPVRLAEIREGKDPEAREIEHEIAKAEAELAQLNAEARK